MSRRRVCQNHEWLAMYLSTRQFRTRFTGRNKALGERYAGQSKGAGDDLAGRILSKFIYIPLLSTKIFALEAYCSARRFKESGFTPTPNLEHKLKGKSSAAVLLLTAGQLRNANICISKHFLDEQLESYLTIRWGYSGSKYAFTPRPVKISWVATPRSHCCAPLSNAVATLPRELRETPAKNVELSRGADGKWW